MKTQLMYDKLKRAADANSEKTALVFYDKEITYRELMDNIHKTASAMYSRGINNESTVTITLPNIPQAVYIFYAANMLGATISVVHPLLPPNAIFEIMRNTNSSYLFLMDIACELFADINLQRSDKLAPNNIFPCTLDTGKPFKDEGTNQILPSEKAGKIYMHSGGTTDKSKTVVLTNDAFNILAATSPEIYCEKDISWMRMIMLLPMFHGFGLCKCMHSALIFGGTLILVPKFVPDETIDIINRQRVSVIIGVPAIFDKLGEVLESSEKTKTYDLSCIRKIFCGGDVLPANTQMRFDSEIRTRGSNSKIHVGYGLTESVAVCTVNKDDSNLAGSIGKPLSNIQIKFIDENGIDSGNEGEICVSGNTLMQGYYGDDSTTSKQFIFDKDGTKWLRTGDYGSRNSDGFLFFKQRIKRMIKYGNGLNIFPVEIEDCAIKSGLVTAAAATKTQDGVLTLFIIPKSGNTDMLISALESFCKTHLPYWCVPRRFVIKDSLPLTPFNKVNYLALEKE